MRKEKGSWTRIMLVTVLSSFCLGFFSGRPLCWGCWRALGERGSGELVVYTDPTKQCVRKSVWYYCPQCGRCWFPESPWRAENTKSVEPEESLWSMWTRDEDTGRWTQARGVIYH